jgi:glycosyltransferase involved in cell wall biosynthesis
MAGQGVRVPEISEREILRFVIVHYAEPIPSDPGFTPTRYTSLSARLISMGHKVTRVAPTFFHRRRAQRDTHEFRDETYGEFLVLPTPGYQRARSFARLRFLTAFWKAVRETIRSLQPDLVLVGLPQPGIASTCRTRLGPKVPIVLDVRDTWPSTQYQTATLLQKFLLAPISPVIRTATRRDLQAATNVIALSPSYLSWARRHSPKSQFPNGKVVPLGAPLDDDAISKISLEASERRGAVFVGSLSRLFDFERLICAWEMLERGQPGLAAQHPLTIVGSGSEMAAIRAQLGPLEHVRLIGHIEHTNALSLMGCAAVGLAPYARGDFHTMPNKFFEYLSAGLPIVSSLGGDAGDLINDEGAGFSDPNATSEWIANRLTTILSDSSLRESMSLNAIQLAKRFSRQRLTEEFADDLVSLANRARGTE